MPMKAIITATASPAMGSAYGHFQMMQTSVPTRAMTDEMASVRWCQAFAMMTGLLIFLPTMYVYQYRPSFTTIDAGSRHGGVPLQLALVRVLQLVDALDADEPGGKQQHGSDNHAAGQFHSPVAIGMIQIGRLLGHAADNDAHHV